MKLNQLQQLIREEILKEIRVERPIQLIKVDNGYELAIGPYMTHKNIGHKPLPGYKSMPGGIGWKISDSDEYTYIDIPYADFGGGVDPEEEEEEYNMWEEELATLKGILDQYGVPYKRYGNGFKIPVDVISNWNDIKILKEIKVDRGIILTPEGEELAKKWGEFSTLTEKFINDWDGFYDAVNKDYDMGMWCYEAMNNGLLGGGKALSLIDYGRYLDSLNHTYLEMAELEDLKKAGLIILN